MRAPRGRNSRKDFRRITALPLTGFAAVFVMAVAITVTANAIPAGAVAAPAPAPAQEPTDAVAPDEAKDHIGEEVTVCGDVVSADYIRALEGRPTFLNLDAAYPDHVFSVTIMGDDRGNFPAPPHRSSGLP